MSDWFNIIIVEDNGGELTIQGEENLLEHIITKMENGKLSIKVEKAYELVLPSRDIGIYIIIPVKRLSSIAMSDSVKIDGKSPKSLKLWHGHVRLGY